MGQMRTGNSEGADMHTHKADGGTVFHHNGDYSGELLITVPAAATPMQGPFGGTVWRVGVPFADIRELVFAYLRARKIEHLEQVSDDGLEAALPGCRGPADLP